MSSPNVYTRHAAEEAGILFPKFSDEVMDYLMRTRSVIGGSFPAWIAMQILGMKPNFLPSDLDIFSFNGSYDEVRFEKRETRYLPQYDFSCRTCDNDYVSKVVIDCSPVGISWTAKADREVSSMCEIKPQIILLAGCPTSEPDRESISELADSIGKSMDFQIVSSTIHYDPEIEDIVMTLRGKDCLLRRAIKMNTTPQGWNRKLTTRSTRLKKWEDRDFKVEDGENLPCVDIDNGEEASYKTAHSHLKDDTIRVAPDGVTDFFMCTNCTILIGPGDGVINIYGCTGMKIVATPESLRSIKYPLAAPNSFTVYVQSSTVHVSGYCVVHGVRSTITVDKFGRLPYIQTNVDALHVPEGLDEHWYPHIQFRQDCK